jgi:hypothetical protein
MSAGDQGGGEDYDEKPHDLYSTPDINMQRGTKFCWECSMHMLRYKQIFYHKMQMDKTIRRNLLVYSRIILKVFEWRRDVNLLIGCV